MKQILSIVLVSALVLSTTAFNLDIAAQIMKGFTFGLNYTDLNPSIKSCSMALNNTRTSASEAVLAINSTEPEVFEKAVGSFGYNFAHSIRVCGHALGTFENLLEAVALGAGNISVDALSTRLFTHLVAFSTQVTQIRNSLSKGDFVAVGEALAEVFKLFVYNNTEIPSRVVRQLDTYSKLVGDNLTFGLNATFLGIQGFIEEANTTIVLDHYTSFVNDTTSLTAQFPALEQAIESDDFQGVIAALIAIQKSIGIILADYALLKSETVAFVQRDLPLFENQEKISKAVESLFLDLPTTIYNVQRIVTSYETADYKGVGHGSGAIYNQLRNGAISNKD